MLQSNLRICRLSKKDFEEAAECSAYSGNYNAEYIWPEIESSDIEPWIGNSPVTAWDDSELASLGDCLKHWLSRHQKWRNANALMMGCLAMQHEISAERLLAACRWFEEIPNTKGDQSISDTAIADIAKVAAAKAEQLGYADLSKRVLSLIHI